MSQFDNIFTNREMMTLSSIVQVGEAARRDLMETEHFLDHPFCIGEKGRLRTKLVQIQSELESHDPKFPFQFGRLEFPYGQVIPELRNGKAIIHIARTKSPETLPPSAQYKRILSANNHPLYRQLMIAPDKEPPYVDAPFYAILAFGGHETFAVIQFPEPGYTGIIECLYLSQISLVEASEDTRTFERKKAVLKKEFLSREEEHIS